jgi:hypothetical protein
MAAAVLMFLSVLQRPTMGQAVKSSSKSADEKTERRILRIINRHPDLPISLNNHGEAPLFIQDARVKQIGEPEHRKLTGVSRDSTEYVSFPTVRLVNNTDKRITGFTLFLKNNRTGHIHGFKVWRTVVEPHGDYSINPNEWVAPEKLTRVSDDGQTMNINKRVNFASEKMWLAAGAVDLVLELIDAQFEDGSGWSKK